MWLYFLLLAFTVTAQAEFTREEQIGLEMHNKLRKVHDVPPMTLDKKISDQAKAYAKKLAESGEFNHSSEHKSLRQGESLAMGCFSNKTNNGQAMKEAVTNWYNEVCKPGYDFNTGGSQLGTGHFTQVVWKESTVLGIGRHETEEVRKGTSMKCAYIVGRYKPAGNLLGQYKENVLKGNFDASGCGK